MDPAVQAQAMGLLQQMSDKLNVATEVIWAALVKGALVNSIVDIIINVSFLIIIATAYIITLKRHKKDPQSDAFLIAILLNLIGIIYFFASIGNIVQGFVNPEYVALRTLLGFITPQ